MKAKSLRPSSNVESATIQCPLCEGEGTIPSTLMDEPCPTCEGEGWLDIEEEDDEKESL